MSSGEAPEDTAAIKTWEEPRERMETSPEGRGGGASDSEVDGGEMKVRDRRVMGSVWGDTDWGKLSRPSSWKEYQTPLDAERTRVKETRGIESKVKTY